MMELINKYNSAIVIVTYNSGDNLLKLLKKCKFFSRYIIVVDNGSINALEIKEICNKYGVILHLTRENRGIGYGLNFGINKFINEKSLRWIITFDQDSLPPDNLLDYYNDIIRKEDNIGLIGVGYDYNIKELPKVPGIKYKYSHDQITSGLLHNVDMIRKIGDYESKYFIDCVDFEYSLRAAKYGYNTFSMIDKIMTHSLGCPKIVKVLGVPFVTMNHNAFRQYYIVRNHIWLARSYMRLYPGFIISKFYHLFVRLTKTILFDDDRKSKIKRIMAGLKDGIKHKMT